MSEFIPGANYVGSPKDASFVMDRTVCTWQGGDELEPNEVETTCCWVIPYHAAVIAKAKSNKCPFCELKIVDITEFSAD